MLSVGIIPLSLILHPFQLGLVRLLEGYWGESSIGSALTAIGVELHRRRLDRFRVSVALKRLGAYPAADRLLPTRLGNTLRAVEDEAGQRYGLATVTMWPRLYPYLTERFAQVVDDARTSLTSPFGSARC